MVLAGWIILYVSAVAAGVALLLVLAGLIALMPRLQSRRPAEMEQLKRWDYAHRGLHTRDQSVPENSLAAFRKAVEQGYGMELDVQLTADGQVVVAHDGNLNRLAGDARNIRDLTYAQLQEIPLHGTSERVPLFSDVLSLVDGRTPLIVEIKDYGRLPELCAKTDALLRAYQGLWCVESFAPAAVYWFRRHHPEAVRGILACDYRKKHGLGWVKAFIGRNLLTNVATRPDFAAYDYHSRSNGGLRLCRRLFGVEEVSWTVTERAVCDQLKADGCTVIFQYFDPRA